MDNSGSCNNGGEDNVCEDDRSQDDACKEGGEGGKDGTLLGDNMTARTMYARTTVVMMMCAMKMERGGWAHKRRLCNSRTPSTEAVEATKRPWAPPRDKPVGGEI